MGMISGWTEGILLSLAFIGVLGLVVGSFNVMYSQNNNIGLTDNSTEQLFVRYMGTAQTNIEGGEVAFDAQQGITLKSSYEMAKDAISIIWTFLSGNWIYNLAVMMQLGQPIILLARFFQIIWFLSLVFAMLYALFKVIM